MNPFVQAFSKIIATVFFIGYVPFAPGTLGSLAALVFVWFLKPGPPALTATLIAVFITGIISSHFAEKTIGEKDSKHIVIDEFAGYLASMAFLPLTPGYLVSAFVLFRFFDIIKPPPIRNLERAVGGGTGIMLDDMLAGLFSNILLQCWRLL